MPWGEVAMDCTGPIATRTGSSLRTVVPLPNCPKRFSPQHHNSSVVETAHALSYMSEIDRIAGSLPTNVGSMVP